MNVRRQRHVADRVDERVEIALPRPAIRRTARRPKKRRSRISPSMPPASPSKRTRAPGFSFCPGCDSASNRAEPSGARSMAAPSSRHSTAPPLGTRCPSSRAANTRVSLTTSRSPGSQLVRQIANMPVTYGARARCKASRRDSPRGAASCAISSSGRSKEKSETCMGLVYLPCSRCAGKWLRAHRWLPRCGIRRRPGEFSFSRRIRAAGQRRHPFVPSSAR